MILDIFTSILVCLWGISRLNAALSGEEFSTILKNLTDNYDKRLRPNFNGDPVKIGITLHVLAIGDLSETSMAFTIDLFLRQYWQDDRLMFNHSIFPQSHITVESQFIDTVWTPDLFFTNEKSSSSHEYTKPNTFLRFSPAGRVWTSSRFTVVASCPMHLARFPHDVQVCRLNVQSYGYAIDDIMLHFERGSYSLTMAEVMLPQFQLLSFEADHELEQLSSGNYSTLFWKFEFGRRVGYYVMHVYLPCTVLVIISFMVFWFPPQYFGDRLALGVSTMLTITVLISSVNTNMPKFSYIKALDFYLLTCFIICFLALIMSALNALLAAKTSEILTLKMNEDNKSKRSYHHDDEEDTYSYISAFEEQLLDEDISKVGKSNSLANRYSANDNICQRKLPVKIAKYRNFFKLRDSHKRNRLKFPTGDNSKKMAFTWGSGRSSFVRPKNVHAIEDADWKIEITKMDRFCRIVFPTFFILFNIVYWIVFTLF